MYTDKNRIGLLLVEVDQNAPLEVREKLIFHSSEFAEPAERLRKVKGCLESVLICTCNRTALLCLTQGEKADIKEAITGLFIDWAGTEEVSKFMCSYEDAAAINSLIELGSGSRSVILGEHQILGQIGFYYNASKTVGMTGRYLNWLIPRIISESRTIRKKFSIGEGSVSLAGLAGNMITEFLNKHSIENGRFLIVGWGEITATVAKIVRNKVPGTHITVTNRSPEKVTDRSVGVVSLDSVKEEVNNSDAVITMAGKVKKFMFSPDDIQDHKPRILIDLGVPRNIDPRVIKISEIEYADIDSFQIKVYGNRVRRERVKVRIGPEVALRAERIWQLLYRRYSEGHIHREVAEISKDIVGRITALAPIDNSAEISKFRSFVIKYIYKIISPPSSRRTRTTDNSIR